MYKFIILLTIGVLAVEVNVLGQTAFSDNFSDGDFLSNPTWKGQNAVFQINTNFQLQLSNDSATSSNVSYLVTPFTAIDSSSWSFFIRLAFAPSANNFARVYLVSNQQNITQPLEGYFVQIGGQSGTVDEVSLYRQDGSSIVKIIDGTDGTVASSPEVKIKVIKTASNQWELLLDETATGLNFVSQGTTTDSTYSSSGYFGVFCRYTATRSDKFFFDDFVVSGTSFKDTTAPFLIGIEPTSDSSLILRFNEPLAATALAKTNYEVIPNIGNPSATQFVSPEGSQIQLSFSNSFLNGVRYDLIAKDLADTSGNVLESDGISFTYFVPIATGFRDVVLNELFPDPNPSNGLPTEEFIELLNASNKVFNVDGWSITDGNSTAILPNRLFRPGEYLILCSISAAEEFSVFGNAIGLADFPVLNNSGDSMQLFDSTQKLIDRVNYDISWYGDDIKASGGVTLEQINPFDSVCLGNQNFTAASVSTGGTPGAQNSVFDTLIDLTAPQPITLIPLSQDSLLVRFNKEVDNNSVASGNYSFSPALMIDTAVALAPDYREVLLVLQAPLTRGTNYSLQISGVNDCRGNISSESGPIHFIIPNTAERNDIVINEILFNPRKGGVDFVELFNQSGKTIGLSEIWIANRAGDSVANVKSITDEELLFLPQTFLAITENKQNIIDEYPLSIASNILEIDNLPSYNDDEGSVYLLNQFNQFIDTVRYSEDWHFVLLQDNEGVSLERISVARPSTDSANFHSASETVGFATPGYKNSQAFEGARFSGKINIEPKIFSPNNDGFNDIITINYQFSSPGFVANIAIFDRNGRLIKRLVQNELLGSEGTFSWDGITDDKLKARIGPYVVLVEAFTTNGNQEVFKEVITVAGNLD